MGGAQGKARNEYIRLLRQTEDASVELLALARDSFDEGWLQATRARATEEKAS